MRRILALSLFASLVAVSQNANAQAPLNELYGKGVHAYFAHDLQGANQLLSDAINYGTTDPRVYFFRGLVQERMGGMTAGSADFKKGAELEAAGRSAVNVSRALERIQGFVRVQIEEARLQARVAMRAQRGAMGGMPLSPIPNTGMPPTSGDATPDALDPFGDDPEIIEGPASDMPNQIEDPDVADPATPSAGDGVFPPADAGQPADAGGSVFDPKPAEGNNNPFGGDAPAGDAPNPFGGDNGGSSDEPNPFGF